MSAALLARLAHLGVSVERAGCRLILDGPEEALTEALIAEIAAAKPALLSMLDLHDGANEAAGNGVPASPGLGQDSPLADHRESHDVVEQASVPRGTLQQAPWRCRCCGSGERRRRSEWGDWVCAFCRVIVAGPDQTERSWQTARRYGPFPGTGQPAVTWGRERGYLAVRDPHAGDWHEIPYRETPPVWQAAVRRGRRVPALRTHRSSDRHAG